MKFISLFAGIGGIDLGLERAGWECVAQVEWDDWCNNVLAKHWPDVPRFRNVRDVQGSTLPAADAIVGGFPCQPVSLAGKREAQSDSRWLWPEFARLVDEVRPRVVVVENVPGLRTAGGSEVVADFAEMGYDNWWGEFSAAEAGAPHLRRRFFLVAYPDSGGRYRARVPAVGESPLLQSAGGGGGSLGSSRNGNYAPTKVAHPNEFGRYGWARFVGSRRGQQSPNRGWWATEPDVGRVANGIPRRVDRLKGLGNAVVPQVAEHIGHIINETLQRT